MGSARAVYGFLITDVQNGMEWITFMEQNNDKDYPCNNCKSRRECDNWIVTFCCKRCAWEYGGDPPCEECDVEDYF